MSIIITFNRDEEFETYEFDYKDTLDTVYLKATRGEGLEEEVLSFDNEILPRDKTQLQETLIVSESVIKISKKYTDSEIKTYNEKYVEKFRNERGFSLKEITFQTLEVCLAAVQAYGGNLINVKHQTPEICLNAVRNYPRIFVECKFQNREICEAAIRRDIGNLKYVTDQTEELCKLALEINAGSFANIREPSESICELAVAYRSSNFILIENQTTSLCELAVSKDGMNLRFVKTQTQKICDLAVDENPEAFKFVKRKFKHAEMYIKALEGEGCMLGWIKKEKQTQTLCWIAIKQNPYAIQYAYRPTEEMWIYAVTNKNGIFRWNETPKTKKICLAALKASPWNIRYIDEQTVEMGEIAYRKLKLKVFNFIQHPTYEMCQEYIKSGESNRNIEYFDYFSSDEESSFSYPELVCKNGKYVRGDPGFDDKGKRYDINYENFRVIELLVRRDPERFRDLHWFNQTEEMCLYVLNKRPDLVDYIKISTDKIYNLLEDFRECQELRSVETFKSKRR